MLVGDGIRTPKLFLQRGREHDLLGEIPKFHEIRVSRETDREGNRISWTRSQIDILLANPGWADYCPISMRLLPAPFIAFQDGF